jgi:hypothetical protein
MCELDAEVWNRFWNGMKKEVEMALYPTAGEGNS